MATLSYRVLQWLGLAGAGLLLLISLAAGLGDGQWYLIAKLAWPASLLLGAAGYCGRQAARARARSRQGEGRQPPAPPVLRPYAGPPVTDPSGPTVRCLGAGAAVCMLVPALVTPGLSGAALAFAWGAGLFLAALLLLMLAAARGSGRTQVRQIEALLAGGHWVQWEYSADEWQRFLASGWQRQRRAAARLLLAVGVGTGALALLVALAAEDLLAPIWVAGAGLLGAGLLWGIELVHARRCYSGDFRQIFIGPGGAYLLGDPTGTAPGRFHQWQGWGLEVRSATLTAGDPGVLEVEISATGVAAHGVTLPVPRGREDEARRLVEQLVGPR